MDLSNAAEQFQKHHKAVAAFNAELQQLADPTAKLPKPDLTKEVNAASKASQSLADAIKRNADAKTLDGLVDKFVAAEFVLANRLAAAARHFNLKTTILARLADHATPSAFGELEGARQIGEGLTSRARRFADAGDGLIQLAERVRPIIPGTPQPPSSPRPPGDDEFLGAAEKEATWAADRKDNVVKKKGPKDVLTQDEKDLLADAVNVATVSQSESQVSMAKAQQAMAQTLVSMADDQTGIGTDARPIRVQMKRADVADTPDTPLWVRIRRASLELGWDSYAEFMEGVLCAEPTSAAHDAANVGRVQNRGLRLPFPDADAYRFLKAATEVFMMVHCDVWNGQLTQEDLSYAQRRLGRPMAAQQIFQRWTALMPQVANGPRALPYLAIIREKLGDAPVVEWSRGENFQYALAACSGILREKIASPCFLELVWSYWQEEGMLVQTMNAITRRFQNVRGPGDRDPLAGMEIDPLRPLNNVLWGYIQDEQHRLGITRRAYEYDHHYGLSLVGKAVPEVRGADSRTQFLEAFHNLLHVCVAFFTQDDDTTVVADGFPVLNAVRDVHLCLTQGAHNQYGDLPWTARQEMLMQQWILARPEFREFLPTRIMVAYPEPWMDRVDAMKSLMNWTDASVLHFRELAVYGERILLGARFNDWTRVNEPERAANWARFWRPEIQGYIHAYRAVTGIDLTERVDATRPSALLRRRLATQRAAAVR